MAQEELQGALASMVRSSGASMDLAQGRRAHQTIVTRGCFNRYLGNLLIEMYGKCGSLEDARQVFLSMRMKNIYSWTMLLNAYARNGDYMGAVHVFYRMDLEGVGLDDIALLAVLGAFTSLRDLRQGKLLHARIVETGIPVDLLVGTALVNLYCKCGSLDDAADVFSVMPVRNVVSWSCMIEANVEFGMHREALWLYREMQINGTKPDRLVFATILETFSVLEKITEGLFVHSCITQAGWESDPYLKNSLITMYTSWGLFENARQVLLTDPVEADVVPWTALVSGYAQHGHTNEAVEMYFRMNLEGVKPDKVAFVSILDACGSAGARRQAETLHEWVVSFGFGTDTVLGNSLVNFYGRCGRVSDAKLVFESMVHRDVVSWGSIITAYAQNGFAAQVFHLFNRMDLEGTKPDAVVFVSVLNACTRLPRLSEGRALHSRIETSGLDRHLDLNNALINMYSKCGRLDVAESIFLKLQHRNTVAWNSLVISFAQHGEWARARRLYVEMHLEGMTPSEVTVISLLSACRHAGRIEEAKEYLLSMVCDHGMTPGQDHYSCMVDVLGKSGWLQEAELLMTELAVEQGVTRLTSLLSSRRIHGDVQGGNEAAEKVVEVAAGFVLLSNLYASVNGL